jgi:hypothetical protein
MPCHDMVMLGSILSSRGGGKWWYWCCEMSWGSRGAVGCQNLDLVFSKTSMGMNSSPASQVFDEMPERNLFLNFANLFGGL